MFSRLLCGGLLSAAAFLFSVNLYADVPKRVVSLSVCADQYLLGMVEKDRIAALSEDADNPDISLLADEVGDLKQIRGSAEEILLLNPDLVIANRWRDGKSIEILRQSGIPILLLSLPATIEEIKAETRKIAKVLGTEQRGEELLVKLDEAIASVPDQKDQTAAYFMPGGYSAGQNTFVDTVVRAAGYKNLAAELGRTGWTSLALEQLVLAEPDLLVMSFFKRGKHTISTRLRQHSAVQSMIKTTPVIDLPDKYWACGGWFLFEAINFLKRKTV